MTRRAHPSWQRRHEAVLRWMIERPGDKQYQVAAATGYSKWQVSRIVNSPEFRKRFDRACDVVREEAVRRMMRGG